MHSSPTPLEDEIPPRPPERLAGLRLALAFLTRLPLPPLSEIPAGGLASAMIWFPVVGGLLGLGAGLIGWILGGLLPALPAAILALGALIWTTGALHEDGLADLADGLGGGRDKETKLAIMRDSRIGTYGVMALGLALLMRAACGADLLSGGAIVGGMIAAGAWSRALLPAAMSWFEPARTDGLGATAGRPSEGAIFGALGLGALLVLFGLGFWGGLLAMLLGAAAAIAVFRLAQRQIGGFTGDVAGAAQQCAEIAILAVAAGMAA